MNAVLECMCHGRRFATVSAYLAAHETEQLALELELERRRPSTYIGTFEDGSQVLVEEVAAGELVAATRRDHRSTWGEPTPLGEAP